VYRPALTAAGVNATTVGIVETRGTGILLGDRIERGSLCSTYGADGSG
jgi:acyl transferase domain-containing protein